MRFESFSKHFPSPRFLKPFHIGVSFSDSDIKAVFFDRTARKPYLKNIIVPLEKGSIVSGSIVNMDDVIKKLSIVKSNFDLPFVFFTIPDELSYIFSVSIPVSAGISAVESVAFTIEENVPLILSDTVFDFVPTEIVKAESEYKASFVVAACAKEEVEKFVKVIYSSGLEPVGCVHESQAIANALTPKGLSEKLCVVHARENMIGIYLVKNNITHFSTLRFISGGDYEQQFLDEYEKFLEYCSKYNTNQEGPIKSVFVCGEFIYAKKVVEALFTFKGHKNYINNIHLSNVWTNILKIEKDTPNINYEDSLNLAGPVGAVLSDVV